MTISIADYEVVKILLGERVKEVDDLKQQIRELVEVLGYADIFLTEFKDYGEAWDINKHNALRKIRQALLPYYEECTCLPDLPDGRSRGHCHVHGLSCKEIYIGGE